MRLASGIAGVVGCTVLAGAIQAQDIRLNEIYISHAGTDDQEFIELIGPPGASLTGYGVCVVEGEGGGAGTLDRVWNLTGQVIPADGYYVMGDTAVANLDLELGTDNILENGTETIYLVNGDLLSLAALLGSDVDPDDDFVTDINLLATIVDAVTVTDQADVFGAGDQAFDGAQILGPDGSFMPGGVYRGNDYPNGWATDFFLDFDDEVNVAQPRTPGAANGIGAIAINEIYYSHAGTDDQEFIELIGPGGADLSGYGVCIVEGDGGGAGTLDRVWNLDTLSIPADGYFVMGCTTVANLDLELGTDNLIENGTDTVYLVNGDLLSLAALLGTDVDGDDNGETDIPLLASIVDSIGLGDGGFGTGDQTFDGVDTLGPEIGTGFGPAGVFRIGDFPGDWEDKVFLDFSDEDNIIMPRTPGTENSGLFVAPSLGNQGPGTSEIAVCGTGLDSGALVNFYLTGAAPDTPVILIVANTFNPVPLGDGLVVSDTWIERIFLVTDSDGVVRLDDLQGGGGPTTLYIQATYGDGSLSGGAGLSNQLQIDFGR